MDIKKFRIGWTFIVLLIIVTLINFSLLKIVLQNGLTSEDWWILFNYKTLAPENFFDKYSLALQLGGLHHAYQMTYIGVLESIFKGNYQGYQIATIIFKILATLSLYPLILSVFKRKLLAFLTTILYAISFSSTGAFMYVCIGSDYLAILAMNLFLLAYYYYLQNGKGLLLFTSTSLFFLSFLLSPIRLYPLLGMVVLIEVFLWYKSKKPTGFKPGIKRLSILFLPFLFLWLSVKSTTQSHLSTPFVIYQLLQQGNYHLILSPFAGTGYTLLPNNYWEVFGRLNLDTFKDFLLFLLKGPIIIYSFLTVLIGLLIDKKRRVFIIAVILANIIFEILSYFLITNNFGKQGSDIKGFYNVTTYAIFLGFYLTSIGVTSLLMWLKIKKSNILYLALFIGPFISNAFLWGTWLIKGDVLTFKEGIHWYLPAAAMGSSFFLAAIMVLFFDKVKSFKNDELKYFLITVLFLALVPLYLISKEEIQKTYQGFIDVGYAWADQELWKNKLQSYLKEPLKENPTLFYFDTEGQTFYPISILYGFNENLHFKNWELIYGCTGYIYDTAILEESVTFEAGIKGFKTSSLCVENEFNVSRPEMFFNTQT